MCRNVRSTHHIACLCPSGQGQRLAGGLGLSIRAIGFLSVGGTWLRHHWQRFLHGRMAADSLHLCWSGCLGGCVFRVQMDGESFDSAVGALYQTSFFSPVEIYRAAIHLWVGDDQRIVTLRTGVCCRRFCSVLWSCTRGNDLHGGLRTGDLSPDVGLAVLREQGVPVLSNETSKTNPRDVGGDGCFTDPARSESGDSLLEPPLLRTERSLPPLSLIAFWSPASPMVGADQSQIEFLTFQSFEPGR